MVYRFPSWYRPKPVQEGQKTGTDLVSPPAPLTDASAASDTPLSGIVPECVPELLVRYQNAAVSTRNHEPQSFENIDRMREPVPIVPEVPVSQTYKGPKEERMRGSARDVTAPPEHTLRTVLPTTAPGVCYMCSGTRRWRSVYGASICATCHPPADVALVAWEGEGEPA